MALQRQIEEERIWNQTKDREMAAQLETFKHAQIKERESHEKRKAEKRAAVVKFHQANSNKKRAAMIERGSEETMEEKERRRLDRRVRKQLSEKKKQTSKVPATIVEEVEVPAVFFYDTRVLGTIVEEEEKTTKTYPEKIKEMVNHMSFKLITSKANSQLYNLRSKSTIYHVK